MSLTPSRAARWFVQRLLGAEEADALGDLEEEFHERIRPTRSPWRAEIWYVGEAWSLVTAATIDRLRRRGSPGRGDVPNQRGEGMMGMGFRAWQDALRALTRAPGTSVVIAATLLITIGATTAIFSMAHAAYLRPFPYPDAERVYQLYTGAEHDPSQVFAVSPADLDDLAHFDGVVEATAGWSIGESVHLTASGEPERLDAPRVSEGFFELLGAQPEWGRFFRPENFEPGRDDVVVLSHGLWTRAFGADESVVGRTLELDGRAVQVVGVAPEAGMVPASADVWRPLALGPEWYIEARWGWQFLEAMVRLTPEADAGRPLDALNLRLAEAVPSRVEQLGQTRVIRPILEERTRTSGSAIVLLLVAAFAVLALACVNIVTVTMARAEGRIREYGLRRALGSGSGPLMLAALFEAIALASVGGLGGLVLASRALSWVETLSLDALRGLGPLDVAWPVVVFAVGITALTGLVMALAPVLLAVRSDPRPILSASDMRSGGSVRGGRLRDSLVTLQIALATTLLVGVGISAASLRELARQDPGFTPAQTLAMTVELPRDLAEGDGAAVTLAQLMRRVGEVPGVSAASAANVLPLEGVGWSGSFDVVNPEPQIAELDPHANMRAVGPEYFETMEIPVVDGRSFSSLDDENSAPVVVVDEAVARRYWPGRSPVGEQVEVGGLSPDAALIVGVVADVPDQRLGVVGEGHVYFPLLQSPQRRVTVVARTSGEAAAFGGALRAAARDAEPRMPVLDVVSMDVRIAESYAGFRFGVLLLLTFGAVAATLAGLGVYGVLAYSIRRREPELAMRMALGATPGGVVRSVIGHSMRLWLIGSAVGAALAWIGRDALLGLAGIDMGAPAWMIAAVFGIGVVTLLGAAWPAGRAVGVDPVTSLRG
ncbi:MAG: ADOP family duplicated permease [Gemmatimonadota bacterium]